MQKGVNVPFKLKRRMETLSLERVLKILVSLGFTSTEAKVYIYLAKMDPQKAKDIAAGLRVTRQQLYPILNNLQKKGVVDNDSKHPALFSALTIEKLLDLQVKKKRKQAQIIKETKEELLESWQNMPSTNNT
jgi:sugar-specific transcriptional regulator TrmB